MTNTRLNKDMFTTLRSNIDKPIILSTHVIPYMDGFIRLSHRTAGGALNIAHRINTSPVKINNHRKCTLYLGQSYLLDEKRRPL